MGTRGKLMNERSSAIVQLVRIKGEDEPRRVVIGAFAQIAAKRHYGLDALKDGDPETTLFMVWVEMEGVPPKEGTIDAFDEWLLTARPEIVIVDEEASADDDTDPRPAGSSERSPDSPPTSD